MCFVEESEFAKREADDDGENDGALLFVCLFCFSTIGRSDFALSIARGKRCDAKYKLTYPL